LNLVVNEHARHGAAQFEEKAIASSNRLKYRLYGGVAKERTAQELKELAKATAIHCTAPVRKKESEQKTAKGTVDCSAQQSPPPSPEKLLKSRSLY
jgi:hypothetical protein